jgi:RNA polymerase sigma-70 factor (ECF subfamily)
MSSIPVNSQTTVPPKEETELVKGCVSNDRSAQNRLYNTYAKKMMTVCYRYSKSWEEAEDTLNEGFMRVFDKIGTYKGIGSLEGWIRRVIVNVAIEKFRKNKQDVHQIEIGKYKGSDSEPDVISQINAKDLLKLVQKLPAVYQMVFNLYVFEGLTHKEIASQLGISEGTSKSNLYDAREWLKKHIRSHQVQEHLS